MNTGTLLNIVSLSLSFIPDIVTLLILSHVYCHSIWTSQLDFRRAPGLAQSAVCPGPGCSGWWTTWCWPLARGHFLYMAQSLHFSWICLWNIGQQLVSPSLGTENEWSLIPFTGYQMFTELLYHDWLRPLTLMQISYLLFHILDRSHIKVYLK